MSSISKFLAPSLLIIVALSQVVLSEMVNLSPWRGGGFGMFATIDRYDRRRIQAIGTDSKGNQYRVHLRDRKIETMPIPSQLKRLSRNLLNMEFLPSKGWNQAKLAKLVSPSVKDPIYFTDPKAENIPFIEMKKEKNPSKKAIRLTKVKISTWLLTYDSESLKFFWKPIGKAITTEAPQ